MKTKISNSKTRQKYKNMTKAEKRLARVVIQVCDEILGPIERDQTLNALEVARIRVSRGPDRQRLDAIKELMTERWHDQASTAEGYAVFDSGAHCDDNAYAAVFDTMYPAFAEISLRVLYGQQLDNDTLDDLLAALLQKLAPV
jgi:hypothetical protein